MQYSLPVLGAVPLASPQFRSTFSRCRPSLSCESRHTKLYFAYVQFCDVTIACFVNSSSQVCTTSSFCKSGSQSFNQQLHKLRKANSYAAKSFDFEQGRIGNPDNLAASLQHVSVPPILSSSTSWG